MKVIYETRGKAAEYAPLSVTLYKGCVHGCRYCFAPKAMGTNSETFHGVISPVPNVLKDLEEDCGILSGDPREILLCFETDPYQELESELKVTRQAIQILLRHHLRFTILTKGGLRAVRDFDLLKETRNGSFGTTLIFSRQQDADRWEPGAASIRDRVEAIRRAKENGIPTWVSIEPVIDPMQCLELIRMLHPVVDHWKIGKINYHPEIEQSVDWLGFRKEVVELLETMEADYYLKKSLMEL